MGSVRGDFSVMPLTDLLQWIDLSKKTGTIHVSNRDVEKKIYFENGAIIFVSSTKDGERLGEYLHKGSYLEAGKIKSALLQSQTMKVPFTKRLIELQYFSEADLTGIITRHAKEILLDVIVWHDGTFQFIQDELPAIVLRGPISLNTSKLIYDVFRELENKKFGFSPNPTDYFTA